MLESGWLLLASDGGGDGNLRLAEPWKRGANLVLESILNDLRLGERRHALLFVQVDELSHALVDFRVD